MTTETVQHPHLADLLVRLTANNDRIREIIQGFEDSLNHQPPDGGWSIAMVLEHLYTTSAEYFIKLEAAIAAGAHKKSTAPWKPGIVGNLFLNALQKPAKLKSPKKFQPIQPRDAIAEAFFNQQDELADLIRRSDGLDLRRIKFGSPVSPLIRFSLGDCLAVLITHQERHIKQMQRVKEQKS